MAQIAPRTSAYSPTVIHHVRPNAAPHAVRLRTVRSHRAPWLWRLILGFIRRPLLALTLGIAAILLFSMLSEAAAADQLQRQVVAAQQTNQQLQMQLTQTSQQIQTHSAPAAIMSAAGRLGWATPTPAP